MMRRASMCLALLGAAVLGVPAAVSAAPTVTFKAKAVPVPKNLSKKGGATWPGTGNILGKPAAFEAEFTIKGNEYPTASEGFTAGTELNVGPAPLRRVEVYLPKGTKITTKGFPICSASKFENHLEPPCPKGSEASPPGEASGKVFFGKSEVQEKVLVQAYFTSSGLTFWIEGKEPASIEQYATGGITGASGPFSKKLTSNVPLIETVTGAPAAIAEHIKVTVGAIIQKGGKLISYGTVPPSCSKGGFPVKAEMWFGGGEESTWQKVEKTTKVPCPKA
ncbi:MAG: hypothetical protein WB698_06460 [Solirubrobacteraceae bacterium]